LVNLQNREDSKMSRGVQIFRQTDVLKAIMAAQKAGLEVHRFEIDRAGKIVVLTDRAASRADVEPEKVST
jgi:hypothetical protein